MKARAFLGQLSDVDIRLLRVFKVVAESGGISAAELEMNIGRSTISRHIKDLEIRLGITLCRRGRAGFALTDEGRVVYEATLRLIGSLDEFRAGINDIHRHMTGSINIALFDKIASNPNAHIHQALEYFDDFAPEVNLNVYVEPLNEIEKGVMDGQFQLGVIPLHRQSASLAYHPLFKEQMYLYCGCNHPLFIEDDAAITANQIRAQKYVGLGYHSPNMEVGRRLSQERAATAYEQEAIVHFLRSGRYLGYLPDHYAKRFVEQGQIRPIATHTFQYECEFEAIVRRSPKPTRIVDAFLQCLLQAHNSQNR